MRVMQKINKLNTSTNIFMWFFIFFVTYIILIEYLIFGFTADDAFIVARYAKNFIEGNGLVYNIGEKISALTSPIEAVILSGLQVLFSNPLTIYKIICAIAVPATLTIIAKNIFNGWVKRSAFLILTAASPFLLMWTVGGLETPILCILISCIAAKCLQPEQKNSTCVLVILSSISFITRYDSILFTGPIIAFSVWQQLRNRKMIKFCFFSTLLPVIWLIFAYGYYGDILPTSFYLKRPSFELHDLYRGGVYEVNAFIFSGLFLLAGFAVYNRNSSVKILRDQPMVSALGLGILLVLAYGMTAGTKHMMFGYRLFIPYLPAIVMLALHITPEINWRGKRPAVFLTAVSALQISVLFVVMTITINPAFAIPLFVYEYDKLSLLSYVHDFLKAQDANAASIAAHWHKVAPNSGKRPRIWTYAGGRLPYILGNAYIYEQLVSYRKVCSRSNSSWKRNAHYTQIIYPLFGTREHQLGKIASTGVMIDATVVPFNGHNESFEVWFNPHPEPHSNSNRVDQACE